MGACRLLLLGPPLFQQEDRAAPVRLRKALALAAYLAVEQRAFSRDYLAALLWSELGQEGALANLRRMLLHLRETLGSHCIRTDGDLVQIDPAFIDVDFVEFQSLLHSHPSGPGLEQMEAAAVLYRGSFLEGFTLGDCLEFDEWQDGVRRRTEEQFDELLESLCREHLRAGWAKSALPHAQRWLELDQLNEAAHRMLMEIHARMGRADLARRQYETCVQALSRDGLEPEEQTRDLFESIKKHRLGHDATIPTGLAQDPVLAEPGDPRRPVQVPGRPSRSVDRAVRRRRWRTIALVAAGILLAAAIFAIYINRNLIFGCDLSVAAIAPSLRGNELTHLRIVLRNDGFAPPRVSYAVAFSSDQTVVAPRDYVVYADEARMHRDSELTVELDQGNDIQEYIGAHNVKIPPGTYSLTVTFDPEGRVWEDSDTNNRLMDGTRFFYGGTAPEAAFAVEVTYRGSGTLDAANPLKLFIADASTSVQRAGWAQFVVAREGKYYLPVDDVPKRDSDGPDMSWS